MIYMWNLQQVILKLNSAHLSLHITDHVNSLAHPMPVQWKKDFEIFFWQDIIVGIILKNASDHYPFKE